MSRQSEQPDFPAVAAARKQVEKLEGDLKDAREALVEAAIAEVMAEPGAWGRITKVATTAGFSDTYLGQRLSAEQRELIASARAAAKAAKNR
ncbi:putative RNase H-like HicB family nuclease [Kitasatospora sp. GP82]|nr:putative RNase H-like HicB family nuclease [Kitasatospora sp. GP82]